MQYHINGCHVLYHPLFLVLYFVSEVYTSFSKYDVNNNDTVNGSSERLVANELFYMYHHMYKEPDYR